MPNKWTFQIPPISDLLARYVGDGKGWIDLFSGMSKLAEFRNDLNPETLAQSHIDAFDYINTLEGIYEGCIFDPPYSIIQVTRSYADIGLKSKLGFSNNGAVDPTGGFKKVKDKLSMHIKLNGLCICFGWNSSGFGESRGFVLEEILLVCHGGTHNDTIVTVERKIQSNFIEANR